MLFNIQKDRVSASQGKDTLLEIKFELGTKKFNGCDRSRNHPNFALRDFAMSMKDTH
jgi:hypothetical protein